MHSRLNIPDLAFALFLIGLGALGFMLAGQLTIERFRRPLLGEGAELDPPRAGGWNRRHLSGSRFQRGLGRGRDGLDLLRQQERVEQLLNSYARRMLEEFSATMPSPDKPTS